jgi:hypothetical protein
VFLHDKRVRVLAFSCNFELVNASLSFVLTLWVVILVEQEEPHWNPLEAMLVGLEVATPATQ